MNALSQLTAVIKTFQRPRALDRLVRSIRRFYPSLAIAVADDGPLATVRTDVDYLRLPPDVGLSAGRNALLHHIRTPYFLLLDDDLEFTRQTCIERLLEPIVRGEVDIAAGDYQRCKRKLFFTRRSWQPFHGTIRIKDGELWLRPEVLATFPSHQLCDIVHNFFVARTADVLAIGGWDEDLKLNEHVEFFVRARQRGMRVGYCSDVVARHWMELGRDYQRYRGRDFTDLAAKKIGVRTIHRFDKKHVARRNSAPAESSAAGAWPQVSPTVQKNGPDRISLGRAQPQIAVILSTYQRPNHLYRSLLSLSLQRGMQGRFEVVVTDDGSTDNTQDMVRAFARSADFRVTFCTHEHRGFQLSHCRNKGALLSTAPYLLFSDGDCIFPADHLQQQLRAARPFTAWSGNCLHLDERATSRMDYGVIASGEYNNWICPKERLRMQRRWIKDRVYQAIGHPKKPKLTGCNIAVWRSDFERINGFDERFVGWGCEDDDLGERLRRSGVKIASILGFTHVIHMWHPTDPSRPARWGEGANVEYLLRHDKPIRCALGLSSHARTASAAPLHAECTTALPGRMAA